MDNTELLIRHNGISIYDGLQDSELVFAMMQGLLKGFIQQYKHIVDKRV